jgi:hypothetical protein
MWGRRKKRCGQLPRQLALGLLEDAMGRVQPPQEHEADEPSVTRYPSQNTGLRPPAPRPARACGPPTSRSTTAQRRVPRILSRSASSPPDAPATARTTVR